MPTARITGSAQRGYTVHTGNGSRVQLNGDHIAAEFPAVRRVGLMDLRDVVSHQVNRIVGSTSHVIRLANGGLVHLAYNDRGELLELSGQAVRVSVNAEGCFMFGACPGSAAAGRPGE